MSTNESESAEESELDDRWKLPPKEEVESDYRQALLGTIKPGLQSSWDAEKRLK